VRLSLTLSLSPLFTLPPHSALLRSALLEKLFLSLPPLCTALLLRNISCNEKAERVLKDFAGAHPLCPLRPPSRGHVYRAMGRGAAVAAERVCVCACVRVCVCVCMMRERDKCLSSDQHRSFFLFFTSSFLIALHPTLSPSIYNSHRSACVCVCAYVCACVRVTMPFQPICLFFSFSLLFRPPSPLLTLHHSKHPHLIHTHTHTHTPCLPFYLSVSLFLSPSRMRLFILPLLLLGLCASPALSNEIAQLCGEQTGCSAQTACGRALQCFIE